MDITQRIKSRLTQVTDWASIVDQLEAEAASLEGGPAQSAATFELARAAEDVILDKARAMPLYQKAFKLDQTNLLALQHAREIYQEMASLDMVTRLMGLELRANQDPSRASALNYAYGTATLNQRNIDTAKGFLEAAVTAAPDDKLAAARLAEVRYDRANWEAELASRLAEVSALVGGDPLAADVQRAGWDTSCAYMRCARILQQENPADPRVLPLVFKALDADPLNEEAGFIAELVLAAGGHLQHIQKLMDRRANLVDRPAARLQLLLHFASVWQVRLNNPQMSAYFYRQALELAYGEGFFGPWHLAAYRAVKRQAQESGQADGVVELADKALAAMSDPVDRAILALEAGELAWQANKDVDTARRLLVIANQAAPEHPTVQSFAAELGLGSSDAGAAEAADDGAAAEAAARAAAEAEARAAADAEARAAADAAAAEEAAAAAAAKAEADARKREEEEARRAAEEARKAEEREKAAAAKAAAEAAKAAAEAASMEPVDPSDLGDESFTEDELVIVQRAMAEEKKGGKKALDAWRDAMAKLPEKRLPVDRLKAIYVAEGKWSNVADLYKEMIKRASDDAAREPLYWELINLYRDQLKQPGLVVTTLSQLEKLCEGLEDNEKLLRVVEAQQQQFDEMKRWPDLIGRIRRRAELTQDPAGRTALQLEAGNLFLEKFNNQAEAIKSFEAVLEDDPMNGEALTKLEDLYGRRRDWEKMISVQQKRLQLLDDPSQQLEQLLEVARNAAAKVKKNALSIELWSAVRDLDPTNAEALEALEALLEKEKDWEGLAKTLETLCEITDDVARKSQSLVKLGLLYSDKLERNADAIRVWESLYELEPENRRAQDALKKLYLQEGRMDALQEFYAKQDKWGEFVRVLEKESETAEGEARTTLLLKIAELYRTHLAKPDRAIKALEKALSHDTNNLVVAETLIELYEQEGDERNLSVPLRIKLAHTEDPEARQTLLARLGDLADRVLGEKAAAFGYFKQALAEDHARAETADAMRRLGEETGAWAELVEAFSAACEKYGSDREGLPLRLTIAYVQEAKLVDLDKALAANQAILEIEPEEPTALASLERLYLALGREADLLDVLQTKLSLASTDDEKRQIQTRIGSIHEQAGHHEKAIEAYDAVLGMGVEDPNVLAALDRIYVHLQRWTDLDGILRRELDVVADDLDARARLTFRLAVVNQDHLAQPATAVELLRQVLDLEPQHAEARQRLEGWLDDADLKVTVAGILLPVYEASSDWGNLVRCLEIQIGAAQSVADRVTLLLRVGAITGQPMQDTRRAFDAYARAFGEDPENEVAQEALDNLATLESRHADLAALYEDAVRKDLAAEVLKQLLAKLARIYEQQLGQVDKSIGCWQRALEIDPESLDALEALESLYKRTENWAALLDVFSRKVGLETDPDVRQSLRFQIAYLQEEMLQQRADAIGTYNEILADDDSNLKAIVALDRLYLAQESWPELAEVLDRQLGLAGDPDAQIALSLRLGAVRTQKLNQAGLAVEIYNRVLAIDPTNEQATAALEALLGDDEQQLAVARILEPIYRTNNDWNKLVGAYEIMVRRSLEPEERVRLLHQIAELCDVMEQPEKAFDAMGRALKEDPSNEDTQRRLDGIASRLGAFGELVALYETAIQDVVDDQLSISILFKIARIFEATVEDASKAAGAYEKILAIDPSNFAAIDALIEVHRRANDFEKLVGAVIRKAEMVESMDDRKQLLLYAAQVCETVMQAPQRAIELYAQVLTIDDTETRALDALEKLYISLEKWEELKDIYTRKTELTSDPEERRKVLRVLGQVYDAELKDVERAIDTYQAILDIDPNDVDAIHALDRLFGQAERWLDQLQILERAVHAVQQPEEQSELRHRIGVLWETKLADPVRAVEAYREVLLHDPNHAPTVAALDRMVHGDVEPMTAAQVLEPYYAQLAEWEKLIDLYQVMVKHTEDPVAQIAKLHQIAHIYERQLQAYEQAFDAYAAALSIDPQSEDTIAQVERLAEVTGDWEKYAALLSAEAEKASDPLLKVSLLKRVARVTVERLADIDRSVGRYTQVLEVDPEDADAIDALDAIYAHQENWAALVDNLRRKIRITGDESESIELQYRMGQIYQQNLQDLPAAIEAYKEILAINPNHRPTLEALEGIFAAGQHQGVIAEILEPIYYASERWEQLVKLGEVKLGGTERAEDRLEIIRNVAEICERRLMSPGDAYVWWLRAYMDDPRNEDVAVEVERLAEVTQEWSYVVDVGDQVLEAEAGVAPEVKLAVLARSAQVLDSRMQDYGRAITYYRRVLELDAENVEALVALDRLYSGLSMWTDLAEILQRRIKIENDGDEIVALELRLAATLEQHLGAVDQAIAAYNRALDGDPRNVTALERLEALYLAQQQWEPLLGVYQKLVDVVNTDEDMAGCYQRMAKIAADALGRESDAVDLWNRVIDLRGEDPLALTELAGLHERSERWDDLVEVLERVVYALEHVSDKVAAYQKLGRVHGEKLGKERNALDAWLNALDLDGGNVETLEALRAIYEQSQAWVELVDILQRLINVGPAVLGWDRMRDLWARLGEVQADQLMQSDDAIAAWQQVLAIRDADMQALEALEKLFTAAERWNEAIRVLERKSKVVSDEDLRIDVLMQIAGLWEEKVGNATEAAGAYAEILELRPGHPPAADALENIYRQTEDWAALTDLLVTRAEVTEDPILKVGYLQSAAKVFEENLGDLDTAFAVLQAAFNIDYSNEDTSLELERIATAANKWSDLLNEYNGLVQTIEDPLERCELWVKIGRWYGEHLSRPDYGIQSLHKALELNPESVNALRELANFHRRNGDAVQLAETLARTVPLEQEPEQQVSTLLDLAATQETGLGDLGAAVESHRRVLEIDGENAAALDALARLHEARQEWNELVAVLNRRVVTVDDPDAALQLRKRVGYVQEAALQDHAAAIETYKDILASEPTDGDALVALERLYLSGNQISDYLEILEAQLDATADVNAQIVCYEKMAWALVEHSHDPLTATEKLEKVIMLDPSRDATYRQLESLYYQLEKWSELTETYRGHISSTDDVALKIELLRAMAEIYEHKVEDVDRAIDTYREILDLDPNHFDAANTLSKLQERIEDWPAAVETMSRLVGLTVDPTARLELLTRIGRLYFEKLEDQREAEIKLNEALTLDPGYVPALVVLANLYKARYDWLKAARALQSAADYAVNPVEKTGYAAEAGFIYLEQLEDQASAIPLFAGVMNLDPEHVKVGRVLADIYNEKGNLAAAEPIYDMLARKAEHLEMDDEALREMLLKAAKVARAMGNVDKALKHYKRAHDVDAQNHEVLTGMADLHFQLQDWEKAFKLYQTILVQFRDSQSDDDTVLVYFRLGQIKRMQGEARKALNYLEKGLEVNPHHKETLEALIELHTAAGDWEGVIQAKKALAEYAEPDTQFALWQEIGALYGEKLNNPKKSSEAYQNALDLRPDDYSLLHTMLELFQRTKQWEDVIRVIDRICELESEPLRRSRYNYTAAVLIRDELKNHDDAIDRFNVVLDDDPHYLKAFQAIDAMVTKTKDWKSLERAYRKMLKRLPQDGDDELKLTLWHNLGEIYRTRLKDFKSAAAAFEIAAKLDPENSQRHVVLAELYDTLLEEAPTEFVDEAVREHQILLALEPFRTESYNALFRIYSRSGQTDKAYCVASTLVFLKKANDEQTALYNRYKPDTFVMARQRLSEETMRKHVFHPDQDRYLTAILGLVAAPLAAWRAAELPSSIKANERVDIQVDPALFSRLAKYVKDVLNVAPPDVYLRPNEPGDVHLMNIVREGTVKPSMVVYQNLLRGRKEPHLAFALGRSFMDLYPPHYAFVALDRSPQNLKQVFMACLRICGMPVQGDAAALDQIAREITGRMSQAAVDQLNSLMKKFIEAGGSTDVKKWAAAVELTGYRTGLLLCGDLTLAALMISQEASQLGSMMSPKDKIKELVLYSISEDYFQARRAVGLQVG